MVWLAAVLLIRVDPRKYPDPDPTVRKNRIRILQSRQFMDKTMKDLLDSMVAEKSFNNKVTIVMLNVLLYCYIYVSLTVKAIFIFHTAIKKIQPRMNNYVFMFSYLVESFAAVKLNWQQYS